MVKIFFFSFLSFFSINAAGLSQLEQYYDSDRDDVMPEISVCDDRSKRVVDIHIPELLIDPFLAQIYKDPKSGNNHIEAISKKILKDFQEYSHRGDEDHFDYVVSIRALNGLTKELDSMKDNLDERVSFIEKLESCHNWVEYILNRVRLTCL